MVIDDPHLQALFAVAAFLFGLTIGSFLNVVIYRLPRGRSVVSPRSACPGCSTPIAWFDNIPVLSWLVLRARCRHCKARISARYAAVEASTGLLFLLALRHFGLTLDTLRACVLIGFLIPLIFIDAEHRLLPDKLTLPGFVVGVIFSWWVPVPAFVITWLPERAVMWLYQHRHIHSVMESLAGAAFGWAVFYVVGKAYYVARRIEGLGFGDVKLMAMVGAYLGVASTALVIFLASLVGTVFGIGLLFAIYFRRRKRWLSRRADTKRATSRAWRSAKIAYRFYQLPFGVFLGVVAIVVLFVGPQIIRFWFGLFR